MKKFSLLFLLLAAAASTMHCNRSQSIRPRPELQKGWGPCGLFEYRSWSHKTPNDACRLRHGLGVWGKRHDEIFGCMWRLSTPFWQPLFGQLPGRGPILEHEQKGMAETWCTGQNKRQLIHRARRWPYHCSLWMEGRICRKKALGALSKIKPVAREWISRSFCAVRSVCLPSLTGDTTMSLYNLVSDW